MAGVRGQNSLPGEYTIFYLFYFVLFLLIIESFFQKIKLKINRALIWVWSNLNRDNCLNFHSATTVNYQRFILFFLVWNYLTVIHSDFEFVLPVDSPVNYHMFLILICPWITNWMTQKLVISRAQVFHRAICIFSQNSIKTSAKSTVQMIQNNYLNFIFNK